MVVIRLTRVGTKNQPKYRVTVADRRRAARGRYLEVVGTFNPAPRGKEAEMNLDMDRVNYWLQKGAQPSDTVRDLLRKAQGPKA